MFALKLIAVKLDLFSGYGDIPINNSYTNRTTDTVATTGNGLSAAMKTYYSDYLIDLAEPLLVHDQFGQKHPIPKNRGKRIEFRKYDPLPKMLTPLTEGVTPDGQKLSLKVLASQVYQYGGYVELSDMLMLTAIDNQLVQATKLLGSQAGRTLDTITREVLVGGTNVQYGEGTHEQRSELVGGLTTGNDYLTVKAIQMAVRTLKRMNAPKINGNYVAIVHPDVTFDLMRDPEWQAPHQYVDTENIYSGEIGRIAGVRFVETTEAKIFEPTPLSEGARRLTLKTALDSTGSTTIAVKEKLTSADATALAGMDIFVGGKAATVASATAGNAGSAYLTVSAAVKSVSADAVIAAADAGAGGRDVYATLVLGDDAYGVTELTGGGLEHIVKQLGSGGTTDPLDQRATAGWKATKAVERLVEPYMVRIETTSSYGVGTPATFDDGWYETSADAETHAQGRAS